MENTTNQPDEKGHDANIVLAVSGQTLKELIFAIGYTLDAIDVRATDVRRYEAKEKAAKILESLMAACASGAVDKTVCGDFYCVKDTCKEQCEWCLNQANR